MNREAVIQAIEEVDARVAALRPRLEANPDAPLPTGTWRVRDALSHLAARANPVPNVLRRLQTLDASPGTTPQRMNIDEINHGQVEERADRSIAEILDELQAGHRRAIDALPSDVVLTGRTLPGMDGNRVTLGESIVRSGPRHEQNHLNDVEAALSGATAASGATA